MQPSRSSWAILIAILALLAILALTGCGTGPPPPGPPAPREVVDPFDSVVARALRGGRVPGAVVAVVVGDTVAYLKAYGYVTVDSLEPLDTGARFQAGPAMALVNALAVSQMAGNDLLSLDAPVGAYVPDLHESLHDPTVAELLTHTAGLARVAAVAGRTGEDDLLEAAHYLTRLDRVTDPGIVYSESPPGVMLAAYMMQRAGGAPYADVVDRFVFQPLGMTRSTLRHPGPDGVTPGHEIPERSPETGLSWGDAPELRVRPVPPESALTMPVRGLYATAPDLTRLVRAYFNGGVVDGEARLRPDVVERAFRARGTTPGGQPVSFGPLVGSWHGRRHVALAESHHGHTLNLRILPDDRIAVILLANRDLGFLGGIPETALSRLVGLPDPERTPAPPPLPAATDGLHLPPDRLVGEYWNGGEGLQLFMEAGALRLRSGDWVLDVGWREGRYHALIPDGRSALAFDILRDANGRLYMWLGDRVLARD